jgi:hypothetical protein
MSFPSISGNTPADFIAAFQKDLPLGMDAIHRIVAEAKSGSVRGPRNFDPGSNVGKQIIRLMGADVPRKLLEQLHGVRFLFLNCCAPAVYLEGEAFPSFSEQLEMQYNNQNGVTASADC